jgi:hypothetical protein
MEISSFIPLENRGFLRLSGPDSLSFLQGLVTQDVTQLTPSSPLYTALLSPKGKYVADFFVLFHQEDILIEGNKDQLPSLYSHLLKFKLRARISLEEMGTTWKAAAFIHPELISQLPPPSPQVLLFPDPRLGALGHRLAGPAAEVDALAPPLSGPASPYEAHRIGLGIPSFPLDLVPDKSIILECGLDELKGISWHKGCYIGQELMARTQYRGVLRKRIFPVELLGSGTFQPGDKIFQGEEEVGEVGSSCGKQALALLRLTAVNHSRQEGVPLLRGADPIGIHQPDWWTFPPSLD